MLGKSKAQNQKDIFKHLLSEFIDSTHELVLLGNKIDCRYFEDGFSDLYSNTVQASLLMRYGRNVEYACNTHCSKSRNPLLADVCFKAGYIDSWGRGTIKIIEACEEAELPEPVLKEEQGGLLSKIFKDRFTGEQLKQMGLSERQIEAIQYTKKYGEMTNSIYQKVANVSKATATRDIKELEERELLKNIGTKGSSAVYKLRVGP